MSLKRYAARRDTNEPPIIEALRGVGAGVQQLSGTPGLPDLLVSFRDVNYLMEIKTEKGKLTPDEIRWIENWKSPVYIVRTPERALEIIGAI